MLQVDFGYLFLIVIVNLTWTQMFLRKLTYIRLARSSFRGGTLSLQILCLFCCYATAFKDYFLLRYLFKYDFNSVSKLNIIFILSILFLFFPNLTVRPRNLS